MRIHSRPAAPPVAVNLDRPERWKADIAESVRTYNRWFLTNAPRAFRDQRSTATRQVQVAMARTNGLARIDAATLEGHPEILPALRMATSPPLARERLVGLVSVRKGLVVAMETRKTLPARMEPATLREELQRIGDTLAQLIDRDICPWIRTARLPRPDEKRIAAT